MIYRNPVIPGFHPDPSVCRVGQDYYLATSSFEYFPGVPLFHSRDLVHWRQIGHCLTRASQLPLEGTRPSLGIYAPTLRHHEGRFYMVAANQTLRRQFFVWADDPHGPWSDPVWVDMPGGDPSLFFDDDGSGTKAYLTCCDENGIIQAQIDIETGRTRDARQIWSGTGGRWPEGPHIYKVGKTYYLLASEGGTGYGHMATLARGPSVWGPFESAPHNPILTHRDRGLHSVQATGHGDLVQDQQGNWWMVFLAIRIMDLQEYHHIGRETFLTPVYLNGDGWFHVPGGEGGPGTVEIEMSVEKGPMLPLHPWPAHPHRDDFDDKDLRVCWNFLRNPRTHQYSLTERPGFLRLKGSAVGLDDMDSPAFVGRRQQHLACRAACSLDFHPAATDDQAGLTVLLDHMAHYEVAVTGGAGANGHGPAPRSVIVKRRIGDLAAIVARQVLDENAPGPVVLEVRADSSMYHFAYSQEGQPTKVLASGATRYLSSEIAGGFTGVYIGMYASGSGSVPADFDWFEYVPL